jgi:hypothetical protein
LFQIVFGGDPRASQIAECLDLNALYIHGCQVSHTRRAHCALEILRGLVMNGYNRHFLIPTKTGTCWDAMADTADDATVRMRVSPQARRKCPALPEFWEARAIRTSMRAGANACR